MLSYKHILNKNKKTADIIVFVIILGIYFLKSFFEAQANKYPHGADCCYQYSELIFLKNLIADSLSSHSLIQGLSGAFEHVFSVIKRPPLYYFTVLLVDGFVSDLFLTANYIIPFICLIITFLFSFMTSEHLVKGSGIFAVSFLSLFPGIGWHASGISMYPFLIAVTTCAFYYLLRCDFFKNRKHSILFGIVFGIGMLAKEQFFLYFLGPLGLIFFLHFFKNKEIVWKNFGLFAGIAFCLGFLPFTMFHLKTYIGHETFAPNIENFSFQFYYYFEGIFKNLGLPLGVCFLLVLLFLIFKKEQYSFLLISSWLGFVLICSLFAVKALNLFQWYYTSALVPGFAVLLAICFKKFQNYIILTIFLVAVVCYPFGEITLQNSFASFHENTWAIVDQIKEYAENRGGKSAKIGLLRDSWECILPADIEVFLRAEGYDNVLGGVGFPNMEMFSYKGNFDIFVFVTKQNDMFWISEETIGRQFNELFPEFRVQITPADIERLLKRKENLVRLKTLPYDYDKKLFFAHIYVLKNKGKTVFR
jgi:hypothetical protein